MWFVYVRFSGETFEGKKSLVALVQRQETEGF
jgi:hypothetical protein